MQGLSAGSSFSALSLLYHFSEVILAFLEASLQVTLVVVECFDFFVSGFNPRFEIGFDALDVIEKKHSPN